MGLLLAKQGRLDEAEPLLREALEGCRRTLGEEHSDTLSSINSMGMLRMAQGKLGEAEPLLREALEGHRRTLGAEHPKTLDVKKNLEALLAAREAAADEQGDDG